MPCHTNNVDLVFYNPTQFDGFAPCWVLLAIRALLFVVIQWVWGCDVQESQEAQNSNRYPRVGFDVPPHLSIYCSPALMLSILLRATKGYPNT